jgi:DNA replication and repair protein RecF
VAPVTASLAVTRLRLSHFRSHLSAELAPGAGPVVLTGANGAGKTNLIEAVSLLSPGRGLRGAAAEEMARAPEALGWKVAAEVAAPDGAHLLETWSEGAARRVAVDGKPASQAALGDVVRVLWLTPAMDRLWMEGASERRRFLERVTLSLCPDHGEAVLGYERGLRERNRLIRDAVRDPGWFDALEAQMASFGARVQANRLRALALIEEAHRPSDFPRAGLALEDEGPRDEAGLRAALCEGRGRDQAAGRSLVGPHRDDLAAVYAEKGMPARLASTGEQKALLISLILDNAAAVAAAFGAAPVLLLDEVAAHLDAGRRAALYRALAALGAQAWMTGTGPDLFAELGEGAQRFTLAERGGVSEIRVG